RYLTAAQTYPSMKPRLREDRRNMGRSVNVRSADFLAFPQSVKLLRVQLFHHAKSTKLTLDSIEVAMVIRIVGDELVAADAIAGDDAVDNMYRERKTGQPRPAVAFVRQVEPRRRLVANVSLRAEIVDGPDQQVRLDSTHQVDVAHRPACIG